MVRGIKRGCALIVIGVLANNYVYMHDVVTNGHGGAIHLGWKAGAGIILTLIVVAIGLSLVWLAKAQSD